MTKNSVKITFAVPIRAFNYYLLFSLVLTFGFIHQELVIGETNYETLSFEYWELASFVASFTNSLKSILYYVQLLEAITSIHSSNCHFPAGNLVIDEKILIEISFSFGKYFYFLVWRLITKNRYFYTNFLSV